MEVTLETVNTLVKTSMPIVKAALDTNSQNPSDFEWIDKIANILDKVTQFAKVYQSQAQGGQGGQGTQAVLDRQPPNGYIETRLAPQPSFDGHPKDVPETRDTTERDNQMKVIKLLIPVFEQYIDKCVKENPNMTIGEAIARLDIINISDAKAMLLQYKAGQGIK
jgi:hypothetical protein